MTSPYRQPQTLLPLIGLRQIGHALRGRRRLRTGAIQLIYVAGGVALGAVIPSIDIGPHISAGPVADMLFATGAGVISFIGVVYSLLFLVVQFGTTTFSPRLNVFRNSPLVWHAFAFYIGVFVFCLTAAFRASARGEVAVFTPIFAGTLLVVALWLFAGLQRRAFASIQLSSVIEQVTRTGLGLRVLADIAIRALSSAINDPTTAVQSLDGIESLLRDLAGRNLDIRRFDGADGKLRVILDAPEWDTYVGVAVDEIIRVSSIFAQVDVRMVRLFSHLANAIPASRWPALQERRRRFDERTDLRTSS